MNYVTCGPCLTWYPRTFDSFSNSTWAKFDSKKAFGLLNHWMIIVSSRTCKRELWRLEFCINEEWPLENCFVNFVSWIVTSRQTYKTVSNTEKKLQIFPSYEVGTTKLPNNRKGSRRCFAVLAILFIVHRPSPLGFSATVWSLFIARARAILSAQSTAVADCSKVLS